MIRERLHGRPVLSREAFVRLRPYLVRSMLADMYQRGVDRLPVRQVIVRTRPEEAAGPRYSQPRHEPGEVAETASAADT